MKSTPNPNHLYSSQPHSLCITLSLCFAIAAAMNACTLNDSGDPGLCGYALSDDAFGTLECQCAPIEQGNREQPILDHCAKFIPANSVATGCTQNHICEYECSAGYVFANDTAKCVPENADQCKSEIVCKGNDRYRCSDNTLIETCQFGCDAETGACLSEVCSANETKCTGDTEKSVCIDNEWKKKACPENQICRKGECVEQVCQENVLRCDDKIIQKCVDNAWVNEKTCEFGCQNAECTENPCPTGYICKGKNSYICSTDTLSETCEFACDADTGKCLSASCSGSETKCLDDGKTKAVCKEGEWQNEACRESEQCYQGACVACIPDSRQCNGRTAQKCVNGAWKDENTCKYGCDSKTGTCLTEFCENDKTKCLDGKDTQMAVCKNNKWQTQACQDNEICLNDKCTAKVCDQDQMQCSGDESQKCVGNAWVKQDDCKYGCNSETGLCKPECEGDAVKCSEEKDAKLTCVNGEWQSEECGEHNICLNDACVPLVCEENEKQCSQNGIPQKCQNNAWVNAQDTSCEHACKDGQCITCADDGTCQYLTVSPAALDILEGHTDTFTISYVIDEKPQAGKKLNLAVSNKDCIEVPATITTGAEPVSVQVTAKPVTAACTSDITISDALGVAQDVTFSISVHLKADTNHNYMIDDFDLKDGKDCRYYADCDSSEGSGDGFCDSFIGFKCSNKCTSDEQCISDDYFCRPDGRCAPKVFETVWLTTEADEEIIFPLKNASECKISVDWGDGTNSSVTTCDNDLPHKYAVVGQHHIKITGTLNGWAMIKHTTDLVELIKQQNTTLQEVISFGPVGLGVAAFALSGLKKVSGNDIPDASKLTTMNGVFMMLQYAESDEFHIENWDTSNVTDMNNALGWGSPINRDISKWDTSNVTDMGGMFFGNRIFNQDIGGWNTSKVTKMADMFNQAEAFNQDIGKWDTSKVTNMKMMFFLAKVFNQDIGSWNTANVTDMSYMFLGAEVFNQNIGSWNVEKVTNMSNMFRDAKAFNQNLNTWVASAVTDMSYMFAGAEVFNNNLPTAPTRVKDASHMFENAKAFNKSVSVFGIYGSVTNMSYMFAGAESFNDSTVTALKTNNVTNMSHMFEGAKAFNQNISKWNVSRVTNMSYMFKDAIAFNQEIWPIHNNNNSFWDTMNVTDMSHMFENATAFDNYLHIKTTAVTKMNYMFAGATSFGTKGSNLIPLAGWDVSKVTDMNNMFNGATSFGTYYLYYWKLDGITSQWSLLDIFKSTKMSQANFCNLLEHGDEKWGKYSPSTYGLDYTCE